MKIEKINDNQIRCTLTSDDLAKREIKMSELKYGKAKTKQLFKEIIQEASLKYGFNQENYAVIVDAIPMKSNCIVLIITKVEDPKEIDTRFSRFAPSVVDDEDDMPAGSPADIMELFEKIREQAESIMGSDISISISTMDGDNEISTGSGAGSMPMRIPEQPSRGRLFAFNSMIELLNVASMLGFTYSGLSSLYKDTESGRYLLSLAEDMEHAEAFSKVCNTLSEYGQLVKGAVASDNYLNEHYELVFRDDALKRLRMNK